MNNKFNLKKINGSIKVPGDKSISHRAVMLSSIAAGVSKIYNLLESDDVLSTINIFRRCGVKIEKANTAYYVYGNGLFGLTEPNDVLSVNNSGTSIRILSGIFAAQKFMSVFTGDKSILKRPMRRIIIPLSKMGAVIYGKNQNQYPPLVILGNNKLKGIKYKSPISSAQVKSAVLFAGLYAKGKVVVEEPFKSRDHTEMMFDYFNIPVRVKKNKIILNNKQREFKAKNIIVPGDISSASYFIVASLLKPGSVIRINNVGLNYTRRGIIDVLRRMGAKINIRNVRVKNNEQIGDIISQYSHLHAVDITPEEIPFIIDEIPVISIAAAAAEGTTVIKGAGELRVKESDRIKSIVLNLKKLGVPVKEFNDGFAVTGVKKIKSNKIIMTYNDHRIAMSFIIASLLSDKGLFIDSLDSIKTSYPGFLSDIKKAGGL